jgi:hypothetical protein
MTESRRRLALMPEVLPEPRAMTAPGDARTRTMAHMQRLLATVAAAGAAASGCAQEASPVSAPIDMGNGPNVASNRDADVTTSTATAPDASEATESTDTDTDTTPDAAPATTMTGYAVVDPVPPPSVCPQAAAQIHGTATWKTQPSGLAIVVTLAKGRGPDQISYGPQSTPSGYGARIVSSSAPGSTMRIVVQPNPQQTAVSIGIPALCNGRPISISLALDLQKAPKAGDAVPLTLSSY